MVLNKNLSMSLYRSIKAFIYRVVCKFMQLVLPPLLYAKFIGVKIGTGCFIPDKKSWSSEPFLIEVGNNCQITIGVRILTHGGGHVARSEYPEFDTFGKVKIGNYVYVGTNALIMPGVTIGDNVLVAAGSVVTKSIQPFCVVGGNPAKVICSVEEYIKRNKKFNLDSKWMNNLEKRELLKNLEDSSFIKK